MVSKDSEQNFGEERDMPADLQEKTPGVYVRAEKELPHELDMLWSHTRSYQKEERSPIIPFAAGLAVGLAVTTAVFMLFIMRPEVKITGDADLMTPIVETMEAQAPSVPEVVGKSTPPEATAKAGSTSKKVSQPAAGLSKAMRSYTVQNGDTLGGIAYRMYGSSAPQYVEKIQRANHMKSPDSLQIDQKLVIPPKDY